MEEPLENVLQETSATSENPLSPSFSTVPFLKNRLDKQEELDDLNLGSNRQLQEEFVKLQNQRANVETEEEAENIDWDFWGEVMADYHLFARENSDELARAIESGIPNSLRGMMWQLMQDPELEAEYARLLKETCIHEKAIMRDLGRTFPHHDYFLDGQGIGQENLFNVLKAYSLYDPDVGYCQGLPFVVAVLLLNMPDEEAFCLLVRLMATYGLRGHFLPEMPALQLRLFQFDRLVEEILPVLHVHFLRQGVKSSMFCSQWFLTMFSYRFPLDVVFRIYDNVLATGIEAIFGFSLALLHRNEDVLLKLKFDDILVHLRNKLFDAYKVSLQMTILHIPDILTNVKADDESPAHLVNQFVRDASLVRITPFMLDSYAHEYQESVRQREAHAIEMDNLRNINRNLSTQIKTLETSLAQLNTDHCEIVKQLVMSRVENEGLESELVRYKLLYADLMHQSEDAGSSHRLSTRPR
ncbi:RabGAP/TBC [Hysterangium stoloniferum]|nr:RabGAP/TBC [Hysterangium stoloniferum]